ncbi:MAG TPA: aldose 1-epimerase [Paraburkholderia sp.]|jgi:aldose 1-epimerase|uniref:aldose 1-epimerase n=1 Tax=Paraburkholderia sp. TaxID=1926495 RepID=UPI002B46768E|nr:aldose 1-epimerase [Paraburkholderia sp.]HKR40260.1 aldose 1-epimerase [Paraburkholderia sp.]
MLELREMDLRKPAFGKAARPGEPEQGAVGKAHRQTTLSNAYLRLDVEAGRHGGIAQLEWNDRGVWTPVFRQAQQRGHGAAPRRLSCQPSIWVQNVAQDIGASATSSATQPVGANRRAPEVALMGGWKVDSAGERSLRLIAEVAERCKAVQTYELDGPTLEITVELENTGDTPLPCEIEVSPVLVRDADTRISAPAGGIWIARENGNTPRLVPAPFAWQFGVTYPLPAKAVDHAFTGWGGRALVEWPARQFSLAIVGNTDCYRLRAYPEDDSFSFQVMNDQSEHRYIREGDGVCGLSVLAAGQTLSRRVSFTVERLASLTRAARYSTE